MPLLEAEAVWQEKYMDRKPEALFVVLGKCNKCNQPITPHTILRYATPPSGKMPEEERVPNCGNILVVAAMKHVNDTRCTGWVRDIEVLQIKAYRNEEEQTISPSDLQDLRESGINLAF